MGCSRALGIISMNISTHYFNHGSTYAAKGACFIGSCFSCLETLIIKPCFCLQRGSPTFDLQDVLKKNIVKRRQAVPFILVIWSCICKWGCLWFMCAVFAATPRCYDAKAFSRINVMKASNTCPSQIKVHYFWSDCFLCERKKEISCCNLIITEARGCCLTCHVLFTLSQSAAWLLASRLLGRWPATAEEIRQKPIWLHPLRCSMQVVAGLWWVDHISVEIHESCCLLHTVLFTIEAYVSHSKLWLVHACCFREGLWEHIKRTYYLSAFTVFFLLT